MKATKAVLALLAAIAMTVPAWASADEPKTVVVERTLLKAKSGKREALAQFVVANWFAMDKVGMADGLFTSYRLYENAAPDAVWDFVVAVGYPTAAGYSAPDVQTRFEKIRAAHKTILIEGKSLGELGDIVGSERELPRDGNG